MAIKGLKSKLNLENDSNYAELFAVLMKLSGCTSSSSVHSVQSSGQGGQRPGTGLTACADLIHFDSLDGFCSILCFSVR